MTMATKQRIKRKNSRSPDNKSHLSDAVDPSIKRIERSNVDSGWQSFVKRSVITFFLASVYLAVILAGGFYRVMLVRLIVTCMYRELSHLRRWQPDVVSEKFYFTQRYILYFLMVLSSLSEFLPMIARSFQKSFDLSETPLIVAEFICRNSNALQAVTTIFTLVLWVLTLRSVAIKEQVKQALFLWAPAMSLTVVEVYWWKVQLQGYYWAWVGAGAVICNDISGYVFGKLWGKTQLLRISPRKTVEGFVGAVVVTYIFMALNTLGPKYYPGMLCPDNDMDLNPYSNIEKLSISCAASDFFLEDRWASATDVLPILEIFGSRAEFTFRYNYLFLHTMVHATFASFIAPFGGLMASAMKRALNIKDFGNTFQNHGGFVDRFDCQVVAGIFLGLYLDYAVGTWKDPIEEAGKAILILESLPAAVKEEVLPRVMEAMGS